MFKQFIYKHKCKKKLLKKEFESLKKIKCLKIPQREDSLQQKMFSLYCCP